ncbi:polysaccharide lyase 6 family protein [Acholeplasma granularum]|uniref:polysaccharide lyase 6 family protein n=1 Tax=Acholeplasma granularum TaxID=264635 RepID=UPI000471513D|nr:polysaccharide lyase 6 family protein [Acholeplasma granularum]
MKKLLLLFLIPLMLIALVACTNEEVLPLPIEDQTSFEELKILVDEFDLGIDLDNVRTNISLPRRTTHPLLEISWRSDKVDFINSDGHVTRPNHDQAPEVVRLTGQFVLSGSRIDKIFDITILPEPSSEELLLEEDIKDLELFPLDKVTTDYLILPRVTYNGSYVEWTTSDASIIDLEGNVTLPEKGQPDKDVVLTAQISTSNLSVFKDFNVKVSYEEPSIETINEDDPRILRKIVINNKLELLQAMLNAKPGDALLLEPKAFLDVNVKLMNSGTKDNPIFIIGTPGQTSIEGQSMIHIQANHVVVANLTFENGSPTNDRGAVWLQGDHLRLTNNLFYKFERVGEDYKWVSLTGKHHEVDRNTFDGKSTGGSLLTIWRDDRSPQFHKIYQNAFTNYANGGGQNGYETIRLGTSIHSQSDSYILIEDNYFADVNGEIEIISVKSGRNMIRNNTFLRNLGHITLRHGKNSIVEGNVMVGEFIQDTGGVRAYDAGHIIRNNYIDGINTTSNTRAGIVIHSGVNLPGDETVLNAQWTPYNVLIENNTIYNSRQSILFDGKYSQTSLDVTLKNNFIVARSGFAVIRYDKPHNNTTFINEHYYSDTAYAGGGAFNVTTPPTGVTYQNEIPLITPVDGLYLHESFGASGVKRIKVNEVGVSWLK